MKATEILISEHGVIERVLASIQTVVQAARQDKAVRPEFFVTTADFIKGFADGCHHLKEEEVLFKALQATGVPAQVGPVNVMLHEHEVGRSLTRSIRSGAEKWLAGNLEGREEALTAAEEYVNLLHQHIFKENNILFPLADLIIPLEKKDVIADDFERVEHEETGEGVHEKYLAMAEGLEAEASSFKL